jgi:hypothetical protein
LDRVVAIEAEQKETDQRQVEPANTMRTGSIAIDRLRFEQPWETAS